MSRYIKYVLFLMLFALVPAQGADDEATAVYENDRKAILQAREGLQGIIAYMRAQPDLFLEKRTLKKRDLSREQREQIWLTWQSYLDYVLALDSLAQKYADFNEHEDKAERKAAFKLAFTAFLANYRHALELIDITENDPLMHVVLNEPVPELGLGADTYSQMKYRFLHVSIAGEFAALAATNLFYGEADNGALETALSADKQFLWKAGAGKGPLHTAENGVQIVKDASVSALFPVQKGVSSWMGDVKVLRKNRSLISAGQIADMQPKLEPGDVLLERREWYLSNIGLPGYWPHAALYIGTTEERAAYFDVPEVRDWLADHSGGHKDINALLKTQNPEAYALSLEPQEAGHQPRVLEAISEGVSFTTLEHSADADSVVVLRPRLSKREKALALFRAFHYSGRPYDFNFDFLTDATLVCTELVYKSYEPGEDMRGLSFPLVSILGRKATPANEIARQFDANFGTEAQQFDFVLFLDGHERDENAVEADVETFRKSWRRPKWHIVVQDTPLAKY